MEGKLVANASHGCLSSLARQRDHSPAVPGAIIGSLRRASQMIGRGTVSEPISGVSPNLSSPGVGEGVS